MWWWHEGGAAAWLLMTVGMVAFWGIVIWAGVTLARRDVAPSERPQETLDRRLASGEIDESEYRRLVAVIGEPKVRT